MMRNLEKPIIPVFRTKRLFIIFTTGLIALMIFSSLKYLITLKSLSSNQGHRRLPISKKGALVRFLILQLLNSPEHGIYINVTHSIKSQNSPISVYIIPTNLLAKHFLPILKTRMSHITDRAHNTAEELICDFEFWRQTMCLPSQNFA